MDLTEKNHQINMTSNHSISSNNLFKSHLKAKSFSMISTLQQLCEEKRCCKGDVNSALGKNSKEPISLTISTQV